MTQFNSRQYSDFDMDFKPHPLTGDIIMKYDDESIKRSVKQLILLNPYDKQYHPELSTGTRELLFEPLSTGVGVALESRISIILKQYEPRIKLEDILVVPDFEKGQYTILNTLSPVSQSIYLERVR